MSDLLSPILFDGYKVYKEAEQSVAGLIPEHVSAVLDVVVLHMRAEQSAQPPCGADGPVPAGIWMREFVDAVEREAFKMRAPNTHTPVLVGMCNEARTRLMKAASQREGGV